MTAALHHGTLKEIIITNANIEMVAGKTGTGTHYKKKYATHGWNVIYFQYKFKKYILVSFVYKGSGSKEAMKLSKLVLNEL